MLSSFSHVCVLKGNATRWCHENGTWESKPNYWQCLDWSEMQSVKLLSCYGKVEEVMGHL